MSMENRFAKAKGFRERTRHNAGAEELLPWQKPEEPKLLRSLRLIPCRRTDHTYRIGETAVTIIMLTLSHAYSRLEKCLFEISHVIPGFIMLV